MDQTHLTATHTHRNDALKVIALLTMLIDHVGYLFFPEEMLFRTIGRIAFPIFAYQIALGFKKTSSRKNYAKRLFLFSVISQIPYCWFNPELYFDFSTLNIMFTFLISIGVLQALETGIKQANAYKANHQFNTLLNSILAFALFIGLLLLPEFTRYHFDLGTEYGTVGILFVLLFYFFGDYPIQLLIGYILLSDLGAYYSAVRRLHFSTNQSLIESVMSFKQIWRIHVEINQSLQTFSGIFFQSRSLMAVPLIWILNWTDSKGLFQIRLNKYVGYWFYPVHITILLLILYIQNYS